MPERLYFDGLATTPPAPSVVEVIADWYQRPAGNPSGAHTDALAGRDLLEEARRQVRKLVRASPEDRVVFTGSGTEANNLALFGLVRCRRGRVRIGLSSGEHPSVEQAALRLEQEGHELIRLPMQPDGLLEMTRVREIIFQEAIDFLVVHLMHYDSGACPDIEQLAGWCREWGVGLVVDGIFGGGWVETDFHEMGMDCLSLAPHRFLGPSGCGVLVVRRGVGLRPLLVGGNQESGLRPGTPSVPLIAGVGEVCRLVREEGSTWRQRCHEGQKQWRACLERSMSDWGLIGPDPGSRRAPQHLALWFSRTDSDALVLRADLKGLRCTGATGCVSGAEKISAGFLAMGLERERALSTVLLGLHPKQGETEIEAAAYILADTVEHVRKMQPGGADGFPVAG